ncbi:DUF2357 domain-containing protein [Clostridium butyricum]
MQTKLTFFVYNKDGILINNGIKVLIIDDTTKENLPDENLSFSEYLKVGVKFESYDNNAILEIDSSISEYPLQLRPSDKIAILSEVGDYDNMLTPGYYGINVTTSLKTYRGLYFIESKSVSWDGIINLRRYLETIMSGLSQNLYIQRMVGQKNIYGDENYSLNKMYSYIKNNIDNVISSLDSIVKTPITDIEKDYKEQVYTKRSDAKSQRWLCTKGLNKNKNVYMPDIVFEKSSFLNRDILENRYTKKILQEILEYVISIESSYSSINNDLKHEIGNKIKNYKINEEICNRLKNDKIVSSEHKYDKEKELRISKIEINKLLERSKFIKETILNITKIKSIVLHYITETWFNDIFYLNKVLKVSQKLLKDNRYYQIYDFYLNLSTIEINEAKYRKPYFPSKKTSKLFEYYSVSLVIKILMNNNFSWESGWLADNTERELFNGDIPSNKPIIFTNDNYRIELVYEKKVQSNTTVIESNKSDFLRMNARHYEPDIILSLFDNETGELLRAIVVEVKCRKSENLQSKNGPSGAIEQIKDYYNFSYYDTTKKGRNKTRRAIIEEIIVLYPKQDKIIEYEYDDINVSFIQVEATSSPDISEHYGYTRLENEIMSCLDIALESDINN